MFRPHCRSIVPAAARRAFTLVELLVVIAIIALLIGIIMPGLSQARDQAKKVATKATMKAIGDSLENFVAENEQECQGQNYPPSGGGIYYDDPTFDGGAPDASGRVALGSEQIFGCQWIVRYLMGKDLSGYVPKRNVPKAFDEITNPTVAPGWAQKNWYGPDDGSTDWPTGLAKEPLPRVGPYMNNPPIKTPRDLPGKPSDPAVADPGDDNTDPKYNSWVFVDTFGYPVLYYAARSGYATRPDAVQTVYGNDTACGSCTGVYNWRDNALFTGLTWSLDTGGISYESISPWDFGAGAHKLTFGPEAWKNQDVSGTAWKTTPQRMTIRNYPLSFAYTIMNKQAFETSYSTQKCEATDSSKATIIPARRETYILLSPGKDGLFGTGDDVTNW